MMFCARSSGKQNYLQGGFQLSPPKMLLRAVVALSTSPSKSVLVAPSIGPCGWRSALDGRSGIGSLPFSFRRSFSKSNIGAKVITPSTFSSFATFPTLSITPFAFASVRIEHGTLPGKVTDSSAGKASWGGPSPRLLSIPGLWVVRSRLLSWWWGPTLRSPTLR